MRGPADDRASGPTPRPKSEQHGAAATSEPDRSTPSVTNGRHGQRGDGEDNGDDSINVEMNTVPSSSGEARARTKDWAQPKRNLSSLLGAFVAEEFRFPGCVGVVWTQSHLQPRAEETAASDDVLRPAVIVVTAMTSEMEMGRAASARRDAAVPGRARAEPATAALEREPARAGARHGNGAARGGRVADRARPRPAPTRATRTGCSRASRASTRSAAARARRSGRGGSCTATGADTSSTRASRPSPRAAGARASCRTTAPRRGPARRDARRGEGGGDALRARLWARRVGGGALGGRCRAPRLGRARGARASYDAQATPAAREPPSITLGDSQTSNWFWAGDMLTEWARNWTAYYSGGRGRVRHDANGGHRRRGRDRRARARRPRKRLAPARAAHRRRLLGAAARRGLDRVVLRRRAPHALHGAPSRVRGGRAGGAARRRGDFPDANPTQAPARIYRAPSTTSAAVAAAAAATCAVVAPGCVTARSCQGAAYALALLNETTKNGKTHTHRTPNALIDPLMTNDQTTMPSDVYVFLMPSER